MAKKLKEYFDKEMLVFFADKLTPHISDFKTKTFIRDTNKQIQPLELKDRVKVIGRQLFDHIPGDFNDTTQMLHQILGPENKNDFGTFNDFYWIWPISSVIEQFGLNYKKKSLDLIYEITKRGTGEFAIRQFIEQDPTSMLKVMKKWSKNKNFHVRRLSSEGWRPRLPWAKKIDLHLENPLPVVDILETLNNDTSKYVQNSVANHMGDLLKLKYEFTWSKLLLWAESENENTKWIVRHAIRNLRKKGDEKAIELTRLLK